MTTTHPATVLLLHGLWMTRHVMAVLARTLAAAGYHTAGWSYASMSRELDDNARLLARRIHEVATPVVHVVAHSYGGVVALRALELAPDPRVRRVVLLGSPVAACAAGQMLARDNRWRPILGKSAAVWETGPRVRVPPGVEVGSIAGTERIGLGRFVTRHVAPNDGVVLVEETVLPGLAAHLVLPTSHSTMLLSPRVARAVGQFLHHGRFT
jgi:pimeloyl-ACP methyl ester carboxylesterase